ncbi:MAG: hypothetical protein WBY44_08820 [Bryobacteraceae bacterium]|jgi:hypothetical protein
MSVTIDDLQVQTQPSAAPSGEPAAGSGQQQQKPDFKAELEKLHVRELRLRAD